MQWNLYVTEPSRAGADKAGADMHSTNRQELTNRTIDDPTSSISPSTSASEALAWMEGMRQRATVVMDGDRPVGVITAAGLRGRGQTILADAEVQDVMDFEVVHVNPSFDVEDTMRTYRDAAWHSVRRRRPFSQHTQR
jgi:predicted transcriptional regulator